MIKKLSSCLLVCLFSVLTLTMTAYATSDKSSIAIVEPSYTNRSSAIVSIQVTEKDIKLIDLQAKTDKKDWISIIDTKQATITENGILTVKSIFEDNTESEISSYIECFDRVKPTITVTETSKNNILITAKDEMSGIKYVYINDEAFDYSDFATVNEEHTAITMSYKVEKENLLLLVEDNAGNFSREVKHGDNKYNTSSSSSSSNNSTDTSEKSSIGTAKIELISPEWTNKKEAYVKVNVGGDNIESVSAKTSRNGTYTSIKSNMDIKINENTDVYVKVTNTAGQETIHSEYIECFDYQEPYLAIVQNGKKITVSAEDTLSGVQTLYVNGSPISDSSNIIDVTEFTTYVYAQAKDNAGNLSAVKNLNVNLNVLKDPNAKATNETQPNNMSESSDDKSTNEQKIYNITIGDKNYTIDELKKAGIPVYILTDIDEKQLEDISRQLEAFYLQQNKLNPESGDMPKNEASLEIISTETDKEIMEEQEIQPVKKKSSINYKFLIVLIIALIVFALIGAVIIKKKANKNKNNDGDLYENMDEADLFSQAFNDSDLEE